MKVCLNLLQKVIIVVFEISFVNQIVVFRLPPGSLPSPLKPFHAENTFFPTDESKEQWKTGYDNMAASLSEVL